MGTDLRSKNLFLLYDIVSIAEILRKQCFLNFNMGRNGMSQLGALMGIQADNPPDLFEKYPWIDDISDLLLFPASKPFHFPKLNSY